MIQDGDITVDVWAGNLRVPEEANALAKEIHGISCELIDLRTICPWDTEVGLVGSRVAPTTGGFGAERCFLSLEASTARVCSYDAPSSLVFEEYYLVDVKEQNPRSDSLVPNGPLKMHQESKSGRPHRKYNGAIMGSFGVNKPLRNRTGTYMVLSYRGLKYAPPDFP
mmetsp:Transcript_38976/g.66360  ORF Transcript_38976/g.66360 Transcript_38976/m.66360 type:complete len:167 (+) Transcript_38976:296-796(+)